MLRKLAIGALGVAALLVAVAYLLPRHAQVERTVTIDRPPGVVFAVLNSYRRFDQWSPWRALDPQMQVTRSGPEFGVGAKYAWTGNEQVGTGTQTIVESVPDEKLVTALDFGDMGPATATFLLKRLERGTELTWTLDSDLGNNPIARWMGLAMDRMVGKDYESGLARLKSFVETLPTIDLASFAAERVDVAAGTPPAVAGGGYAGPALRTVHLGPAETIQPTYDRLAAFAAVNGYRITGPTWVVPVDDPATTSPPWLKTEVYVPVAD